MILLRQVAMVISCIFSLGEVGSGETQTIITSFFSFRG